MLKLTINMKIDRLCTATQADPDNEENSLPYKGCVFDPLVRKYGHKKVNIEESSCSGGCMREECNWTGEPCQAKVTVNVNPVEWTLHKTGIKPIG